MTPVKSSSHCNGIVLVSALIDHRLLVNRNYLFYFSGQFTFFSRENDSLAGQTLLSHKLTINNGFITNVYIITSTEL